MVPNKRFKRNQQHPQRRFVPRKRFRWYQTRISHGTRRTGGEQSDCERQKRRLPFPFSLGRCHGVTEGYDTARPGARTKKRLTQKGWSLFYIGCRKAPTEFRFAPSTLRNFVPPGAAHEAAAGHALSEPSGNYTADFIAGFSATSAIL